MTVAQVIQEITPASVKKLRSDLRMNRAAFARLAGASERTIANWEAGSGEPHAVSEKQLIQLVRLCRALLKIVSRSEIGPWFERPNAAFGGLKPMEVVERGEADRIWNMIFALREGAHV